jgi:cobyrinic acid a,c-diamide synthase
MYLADELESGEKVFPMAGCVPGRVRMTRGLQNFGYCAADEKTAGHEFHYSSWDAEAENANLWTVAQRRSGTSRREGFSRQGLRATYVHSLWKRSPMTSALFSLSLDAS